MSEIPKPQNVGLPPVQAAVPVLLQDVQAIPPEFVTTLALPVQDEQL